MEPQDDFERIDRWLEEPTEIRLTVNRPFKTGFLMGLGCITSVLLSLVLAGAAGLIFSGLLINNFLNSNPIEQHESHPEQLNP
jgi:hypothetical protein